MGHGELQALEECPFQSVSSVVLGPAVAVAPTCKNDRIQDLTTPPSLPLTGPRVNPGLLEGACSFSQHRGLRTTCCSLRSLSYLPTVLRAQQVFSLRKLKHLPPQHELQVPTDENQADGGPALPDHPICQEWLLQMCTVTVWTLLVQKHALCTSRHFCQHSSTLPVSCGGQKFLTLSPFPTSQEDTLPACPSERQLDIESLWETCQDVCVLGETSSRQADSQESPHLGSLLSTEMKTPSTSRYHPTFLSPGPATVIAVPHSACHLYQGLCSCPGSCI